MSDESNGKQIIRATDAERWNLIQQQAKVIADSKFFGCKTLAQAACLMMIADAEGRAPALAAMEYHIIQGRPALKADAMLARFQNAGGKVNWDSYGDEKVAGTFSHVSGGTVTIKWDVDKAIKAGLCWRGEDGKILQTTKDGPALGMWHKYPAQMMRSRCISEGVRTVCPAVCVGVYTVEEVEQFNDVQVTVVDTKREPVKSQEYTMPPKKSPADQQPDIDLDQHNFTEEDKVQIELDETRAWLKEKIREEGLGKYVTDIDRKTVKNLNAKELPIYLEILRKLKLQVVDDPFKKAGR